MTTLDAEIHDRIQAAGLWDDPAWQHLTDWNQAAYQRAKDTT